MKAAKAASFLVLCTLLCPLAAWAQTGGLPMVTSTPGAAGSQTYTLSIQSLLTLTALTFIPAALLMMTSFTRIIIVLSLLRAALGTQNSPPNQVLLGLSLFLTFFIMSPVLDTIYTEAYLPLSEDRITDIHFIVNTPSGHEAREDEVQIRSTAIAQKISHATNLSAAEASVKAIRSLKNLDLTVKPLQEYHA